MTEFEYSPLFAEVQQILAEGPKPTLYHCLCVIRAGDVDITPLKVLTLERVRDYEKDFADQTLLEVVMGIGTYSKVLHRAKDRLWVTLHFLPLQEVTGHLAFDTAFSMIEYRAVLIDQGNPTAEGNQAMVGTIDQLDLGDIAAVRFQLLDPATELLRAQSVGGIYRQTTPGDLLRSALDITRAQVSLPQEQRIRGVDAVSYDNTTPRSQIAVPHGTPLTALPDWLQQRGGGIYSTGVGCYMQAQQWYLYPVYQLARYQQTSAALTIINVPARRFPNVERTYRAEGRSVTVLSTGEVTFRAVGEVSQVQDGNGIRFTDTSTVLEGVGVVQDNRLTIARARRNSEFAAEARTSGVNHAPVLRSESATNAYAAYSQLAPRQGVAAVVTWENSVPALLYPGHPVCFYYVEDNVVKALQGTLLQCIHRTTLAEPGVTATRHRTDSVLTLFLEKPDRED